MARIHNSVHMDGNTPDVENVVQLGTQKEWTAWINTSTIARLRRGQSSLPTRRWNWLPWPIFFAMPLHDRLKHSPRDLFAWVSSMQPAILKARKEYIIRSTENTPDIREFFEPLEPRYDATEHQREARKKHTVAADHNFTTWHELHTVQTQIQFHQIHRQNHRIHSECHGSSSSL